MRQFILVALLALGAAAPAQEAPGAFLGVTPGALDAESRAQFGVPEGIAAGVVIHSVLPESPAARAGWREGDVVTFFDGKEGLGPEELRAAIRARKPGDEVTFVLRRGKESVEGTLKLGSRDEVVDARVEVEATPDWFDFQPREIMPGFGLARWLRREESALAEAKERGDPEKAKYHEARLDLLREMEREAPRRVGDRFARIEERLDEVLRLLKERK
ncbi:MAG: S1C family serine protease [Planctomycetota bacterium]